MKKIYTALFLLSIAFISGCGKDDGPTISFEEQLEIDLQLIDDYLDNNDINALIHESEIRYVINLEGDGNTPEIGDELMVKYQSYFLDESFAGGDTIGFSLPLTESLVEAWQLMMPEMKEGGKMTIYSPSGYLFGPAGLGENIPPNAILIYEIELIAIVDDAEERFLLEEDIIDEYLLENDIETEIHSSRIRYTVLEEGTGKTPTTSDNVLVTYQGTFLTGEIFDAATTERTILLSQVIEAWRIMLPTMKEGGRIKFYSPSTYCYGELGSQTIAPNTVLAFEIGLVEVRN